MEPWPSSLRWSSLSDQFWETLVCQYLVTNRYHRSQNYLPASEWTLRLRESYPPPAQGHWTPLFDVIPLQSVVSDAQTPRQSPHDRNQWKRPVWTNIFIFYLWGCGVPLPFYSQGQSNLKLIAVSFLTEFLDLPTKLGKDTLDGEICDEIKTLSPVQYQPDQSMIVHSDGSIPGVRTTPVWNMLGCTNLTTESEWGLATLRYELF